jgi:TRAP-type C4-dicarboxylate transport system substrate-binding protein
MANVVSAASKTGMTGMNRRMLTFCLLLSLTVPAGSLTVKLGSPLPDGSPWDLALHDLSARWHELSAGSITVKIYPGGITGDEPDMLRKLRIGQLQAAVLTGSGLAQIDPALLALQLPLLIADDQELFYLLGALRSSLAARLKAAGYQPVLWTVAGWAHFFSRHPVSSPADLQKQKLHMPEGNPRETEVLKRMGFHVVPLPIGEVLLALQSGMVEAFIGSPLTAAVMQWFGAAKNMCSLRWAPLIGAVVVDLDTWEQVPAPLRPRLLEAAAAVETRLQAETNRLERTALQVMLDNGLQIRAVGSAARAEWEALASRGILELLEEHVPEEAYREVTGLLEAYRMKTGGNSP